MEWPLPSVEYCFMEWPLIGTVFSNGLPTTNYHAHSRHLAVRKSTDRKELNVRFQIFLDKSDSTSEELVIPVYLCLKTHKNVDAINAFRIESSMRSHVRLEYWYCVPYDK